MTDAIKNTDAVIADGVNLEDIREFAKSFKMRRLSLNLTQTQVGLALSQSQGPSYSQSAICRFEKLEITPKSAQKIKPVLEAWMSEAEIRMKNGDPDLIQIIGSGNDPNKKRKRRTSFTPAALEILLEFFKDKTPHPDAAQMCQLAKQLNYDKEVIRVWFCNKRQSLKNKELRRKNGTASIDDPNSNQSLESSEILIMCSSNSESESNHSSGSHHHPQLTIATTTNDLIQQHHESSTLISHHHQTVLNNHVNLMSHHDLLNLHPDQIPTASVYEFTM